MKGVSPLIAVIMLIAFVLIVAGIFYTWVSQFTYMQREEIQFCARASILLQRAYYNVNTDQVNLIVYNTGDVPLKGFNILLSSRGGDVQINKDFLGREIKARDIGILPVDFSSDLKEIVVQSIECKGAQDMVNIYDVEGL